MSRLYTAVILILFALPVSAQQAALVSVTDAKTGEMAQMNTYVGTIGYYATSKIPAERSGVVEGAFAEEGALVKAGATLLTINKDVLMQNIASTTAKYEQQKLTYDKAKRDYERAKTLFQENATTEQRYLDSETDYRVQQQLINASRAELAILQEDNKRSTVKAPYEGIIVKKYVNKGDWVSTGSTVYEIVQKRLEVTVNVPQSAVQTVKTGGKVVVGVEQKKYSGTVRAVIPSGDAASRTFPVKIDLEYTPELLGGMDAQVSIPAGARQSALSVPIDAIVRRNNTDAVFIIENGKAELVAVKIIGYEGANAGIAPNPRIKQVVTTGNERLSPGQAAAISGKQ